VPAIRSCRDLCSLPATKSTNDVIAVIRLRTPSMKRPTISRKAMYQKPATLPVSGRQARIFSNCRVGVWPLGQTMRPQMM